MDFESILEEILLGRGQGNLKLNPKQKEGLQAIVFERSRLFHCRSNCRITETLFRCRKKQNFPPHNWHLFKTAHELAKTKPSLSAPRNKPIEA